MNQKLTLKQALTALILIMLLGNVGKTAITKAKADTKPVTGSGLETDEPLTSSTFSVKLSYPDEFNNPEEKTLAEKAALDGIATGYPDGTFKPYQNITRAEFSSMLVHAGYIPDTNHRELIKGLEDYWASVYLATAINGDYIGLQQDQLNPEGSVTHGELAMATIKLLSTKDETLYTVMNENILTTMTDNDQQMAATIILSTQGYDFAISDVNKPLSRIKTLQVLTEVRNTMYPPINQKVIVKIK